MTSTEGVIVAPVDVRVVSTPATQPCDVVTSFATHQIDANNPVQLLGHAPNRVRALIYLSDDNAILTDSFGRASNHNGINPPSNATPMELDGTTEVWAIAVAGQTTTVLVVTETKTS